MSLEAGKSFGQIVGVEPFNIKAADMGLLRVAPGNPANSYLLIKVAGPLPAELGVQMPQFQDPLTEDEVRLIREWIEAGALPEATAAPTAPTATPTATPTPSATRSDITPTTFAAVQTIFSEKCATVGCHSGPFPANAMSLEAGEAFDHIVGVEPFNISAAGMGLLRVAPGNADNSFLYIKVSSDPPSELGTRMPQFQEPLSAQEVKTIRDWIDSGASP